MIAIDTNILVYAHREDSSWHKEADHCITNLAESSAAWAIPWPCIHEYLAITTHPKIYKLPTPLKIAIKQIECWLEAPSVTLLSETETYWPKLSEALKNGKIAGPQVHDARIAALCLLHGVKELWTADRDFTRFKSLKVRNPLITS